MFLHVEELESLEKIFERKRGDLVIIYGRRRLGKTTLVLKLIEKHSGIYLYTPKGSMEKIISFYTSLLKKQLKIKILGTLNSFEEFMDLLYELAKEKQIVIAIDEFQRLYEADSSSITMLQYYWDRKLKETPIKLLLVGSIIGTIEKIAINGDSPLYGRSSRTLKLGPLPYYKARRFWEGLMPEEKIAAYGVFGGTPAYMDLYDKEQSLFENIKRLMIDKGGALIEEPEKLLIEELRVTNMYMEILEKISMGFRGIPLGKIQTNKGNNIYYINRLEKMDIVERIYPIGKKKRGSIYSFKDEFFRFWFRFIARNYWMIEMGRNSLLLEKIKEDFAEYLGYTAEKVLRELMALYSGRTLEGVKIPLFQRYGIFWDKDIEVDGIGVGKNTVIIGEAKWHSEPLEAGVVVKTLMQAQRLVKMFGKKNYLIIYFAKNGFKKKIEDENIIYLDCKRLDELFEEIE